MHLLAPLGLFTDRNDKFPSHFFLVKICQVPLRIRATISIDINLHVKRETVFYVVFKRARSNVQSGQKMHGLKSN